MVNNYNSNYYYMKTRDTKQKQLVLEAVQHSHRHLTADEVYQQVKKKMKRVSLGTVYRNLRHLTREGRLREVLLEKGIARYDGNLHQHAHFVCEKCGEVLDLPWDFPEKLVVKLEKRKNILVTSQRLDFYGLCPKCLKNAKTRR